MGNCCFKAPADATVVEGNGTQETGDAANRRGQRASNRAGADQGVGPSNKLLCRKPPTWKSDAPMTRGQLLSKRDEFWDTAPAFNGRSEIWQALRAAAECDDTATAQAITSAVNVTLPLGNLSIAYDELGNKYEIPPYCLSNPTNLLKQEDDALHAAPGGALDTEGGAEGLGPQMTIKLRLNTGKELIWTGHGGARISTIKQFILDKEGIALDRQRVLFSGQLLMDSQTLAEKKVMTDSVVQIMVRPEE